jgi:hypothetical protein
MQLNGRLTLFRALLFVPINIPSIRAQRVATSERKTRMLILLNDLTPICGVAWLLTAAPSVLWHDPCPHRPVGVRMGVPVARGQP